jgi:hypothetical protein
VGAPAPIAAAGGLDNDPKEVAAMPEPTNHPHEERRGHRKIREADRRQRIMRAAGLTDPDSQLSDRGRLVVDRPRGDETVVGGAVELHEGAAPHGSAITTASRSTASPTGTAQPLWPLSSKRPASSTP